MLYEEFTPVEEIPEISEEDKNASLPIEIEIKISNIRGLIRVYNYKKLSPEQFINQVLKIYFDNTRIPELKNKEVY